VVIVDVDQLFRGLAAFEIDRLDHIRVALLLRIGYVENSDHRLPEYCVALGSYEVKGYL